jgi:hypothetical protein
MKRRSFLKIFAVGAIAAGGAVKVASAAVEAATESATPASLGYVLRPNPAWVTAPYEETFLFGSGVFQRLAFNNSLDPYPQRDPFPRRGYGYNPETNDLEGEVAPFITIPVITESDVKALGSDLLITA